MSTTREELEQAVAQAEADMAASIGTPAWDEAYGRKDKAEEALWRMGAFGISGHLTAEEFKNQYGWSA